MLEFKLKFRSAKKLFSPGLKLLFPLFSVPIIARRFLYWVIVRSKYERLSERVMMELVPIENTSIDLRSS